MPNDHINRILATLSSSPWVYQMKDASGKVIYVGKAKNLKNRVSQYFQNHTGKSRLTLAKYQMVEKISDIEIILCETEVEALVLETSLIKHLTPKYNILMKDDKNLAYMKITHTPVPELIKTRKKVKDGGIYFGPYVSWVEQSVRALRKIFRIRNCRVQFATRPKKDLQEQNGNVPSLWTVDIYITDRAGKSIPCMDYFIGLCPWPCLLWEDTIREHAQHIQQAKKFLSGETKDILTDLDSLMRQKARNLDFEWAQQMKETIESLQWLHERQTVRDIVEGDVDVFLTYEKNDIVFLVLTQIRASNIVGVFRHEVEIWADEKQDIAISFLMSQYIDAENIPHTLLLTEKIEDEAFLWFLRASKIAIEYPQIWPKRKIIDFTKNQIREYAYKREMRALENNTLTREHMAHILTRLGYPTPTKWAIIFECYDISHTDGHFTYGSRVVLINGKPDTSRYKKYKIKTLSDGEIDDFKAHREVMMRRTIEGCELQNFPHLIIIDGGKWQLSLALSGIREGLWKYQNSENIETAWETSSFFIPLCSLAKREEEVFLPWNKDPIIFPKGSPELMVLQKARDESHRFSLMANRGARTKSMKKNILEELPHIGPITRKKLLALAGSIDGIRDIPREELKKILTKLQLDTLYDHGILSME